MIKVHARNPQTFEYKVCLINPDNIIAVNPAPQGGCGISLISGGLLVREDIVEMERLLNGND